MEISERVTEMTMKCYQSSCNVLVYHCKSVKYPSSQARTHTCSFFGWQITCPSINMDILLQKARVDLLVPAVYYMQYT